MIIFTHLKPQLAEKTKQFCLEIIKEVYGYEYRKDWHNDLDSLLTNEGEYTRKEKGAFYLAIDNDQIIGTIGIKSLKTKPAISKKLNYDKEDSVGSIWRVYIKSDYRNKGIGIKLVALGEEFASKNNYKKLYLHTSNLNPNALRFWKKRGYKTILIENDSDQTIHMEKRLQ